MKTLIEDLVQWSKDVSPLLNSDLPPRFGGYYEDID